MDEARFAVKDSSQVIWSALVVFQFCPSPLREAIVNISVQRAVSSEQGLLFTGVLLFTRCGHLAVARFAFKGCPS